MKYKNIIKIISALIIAVMILSGCGEAADTTADNTPDTIKPIQTDETTDPITEAVTEAETEPEETEAPQPEETRISFLACGDNIVHEAVFNNAKTYAKGTGNEYNFVPIYEAVADYISSADIAMINQESQIGGDAAEIAGFPRFNTPEQMGLDLVNLGFDVVSMANNHMYDLGTKGMQNSIAFWRSQDILSIGGYESKEDYDTIRVLESKGVKIAFLAYTEMTNRGRSGENGYITPLLDEATVKRQVAAAKDVADLVVVMPHWGKEDNFDVTSTQKKYAKLFAECGVDVVIGMHSHVAGKIEMIDREDGGKMLCAYSLGNFVSTMEPAKNIVGYMLSFDIVQTDDGFVFENIVIIPTVTYFKYSDTSNELKDRDGLKLYLLSDFTDELAAKHAYNKNESKKIRVDELKKYITDTVDAQYLPDYLK